MDLGFPVIPTLLVITLVASLVTFRLPALAAKRFALLVSLLPLAYGTVLLFTLGVGGGAYEPAGMTDYESYAWIDTIGARFTFGVDGLSAPMIFLTALLTTLVLWFSWNVTDRAPAYYALFLLLEFAVLGVFTALDYFLFYVMWELVLIPMFFLILLWGGPNRKYAAIKFFAFTFIASLVMLLGIMTLYVKSGAGTFDILELAAAGPGLSNGIQGAVFLTFLVGFGTKMPLVPVHTWLPDAHVQAPTGGSVMLAGVLLKLGAYGLLRIAFPTVPEGAVDYQPLMVLLGLAGLVYTAFVALGQKDLKSMIAYSSISHMGAALLGFASFTHLGMVGGMYMMFAHGLISAALFMGAGVVQHHAGTRLIPELGGLAHAMPKAVVLIMVAFLASLGLPGMAGFVAEFLIFLAIYKAFAFTLLVAVIAVPVTAGFYLYAAKRAFFGPLNPRLEGRHMHDVAMYEWGPMMVLLVLTVLFGVAPLMLTDMMNGFTDTLFSAMAYEFQYAIEGVA